VFKTRIKNRDIDEALNRAQVIDHSSGDAPKFR